MPSVSVVIPTRNESANIERVIGEVQKASLDYNIIVVDDSDDDRTKVLALANGAKVIDGQHKGLGQAIIDGIRVSSGDIVVVMDADLSHQPSKIPELVGACENGYDMAIGSRYVRGGSTAGWTRGNMLRSIIGAKIMWVVTGINDCNSGFFAFKRSIIDGVELKATSMKIMLEVAFKGNINKKKEIPIEFKKRVAGESKNSSMERFKHSKHLICLLAYRMRRFIKFAIVGGFGNITHFTLLYCLTEYGHMWYMVSAIIAVTVAATQNYILNHYVTFKKAGNKNLFKGWIKYMAVVGIGDGLYLLLLYGFTEVIGFWYMISALLANGIVLVFRFSIVKRWVWGIKGKAHSITDKGRV